jgi:hypothetical protein
MEGARNMCVGSEVRGARGVKNVNAIMVQVGKTDFIQTAFRRSVKRDERTMKRF